MADNIELILSIVTLIGAFVSVVWRVASLKKEMHDYINKKDNSIERRIEEINHKLEIEIKENEHREETIRYLINGYAEKSEHSRRRLEQAIVDINNYLEKTGEFQPRRGLNRSD